MKRIKIWPITIVIFISLLLAFKFTRIFLQSYFSDEVYSQTENPVLGIFDRSKQAGYYIPASLAHYELVWKSTAFWQDDAPLKKALEKGDVLITIESWLKGNDAASNVLSAELDGKFDKKIKALGAILANSKHQAYIRWNPDMDVPAMMYPWQLQSPQQYIQAFNDFSRKLKQYAPDAKMVWGPSGYPGDTEYWPGNKEVDLVSITLGSASEYSTTAYPFATTVPDILRQKIHRLRFINKPVMVLGTWKIQKEQFQEKWLQDQVSFINQYSQTIYSPSLYTDSSKVKPSRSSLQIGVYDPNMRLINQPEISIEHIFMDWGELQRGHFQKEFTEIVNRHHSVILTMEPWKDTSGKKDSTPLQSILSGRYDREIRKLFHIISGTSQTVYLRWMHEMEIPIHRYAWQSQDPVTYINAYRYFMQFEGGPGKNVKKVWGPAGDRGSIDFWPGDDVVDFISIAIYGLPDKNITDSHQQEAFSNIFSRKFYRMRFSDKPLFITEFGVKGPEQYQDKWLQDAAKTINNCPAVFGVSYFNLYDNPKAWGSIKAPDWSITPGSMKQFSDMLK